MVRGGRRGGGDRASRPPLRPRRTVAPRGGRGEPRAAGAGGGGTRAQRGGRAMIEVVEPATEEVMATVPEAGAEETDAAVAAAKRAYPAWRAVAPADRSKLLHGLADALAEHHEELAVLEARNAGKPI